MGGFHLKTLFKNSHPQRDAALIGPHKVPIRKPYHEKLLCAGFGRELAEMPALPDECPPFLRMLCRPAIRSAEKQKTSTHICLKTQTKPQNKNVLRKESTDPLMNSPYPSPPARQRQPHGQPQEYFPPAEKKVDSEVNP